MLLDRYQNFYITYEIKDFWKASFCTKLTSFKQGRGSYSVYAILYRKFASIFFISKFPHCSEILKIAFAFHHILFYCKKVFFRGRDQK
jgi:hypothetical protein